MASNLYVKSLIGAKSLLLHISAPRRTWSHLVLGGLLRLKCRLKCLQGRIPYEWRVSCCQGCQGTCWLWSRRGRSLAAWRLRDAWSLRGFEPLVRPFGRISGVWTLWGRPWVGGESGLIGRGRRSRKHLGLGARWEGGDRGVLDGWRFWRKGRFGGVNEKGIWRQGRVRLGEVFGFVEGFEDSFFDLQWVKKKLAKEFWGPLFWVVGIFSFAVCFEECPADFLMVQTQRCLESFLSKDFLSNYLFFSLSRLPRLWVLKLGGVWMFSFLSEE